MDDGSEQIIYTTPHIINYIYILYVLANILHFLSILFHIFHHKSVDLTTVGFMLKLNIEQICTLFIEETTTLKCDKFNEDTIYHILPEFGPQGGYIRRLSSEIMSAKFHDV